MVYVDEIAEYPGKGKWCHMVADNLDELHAMAAKIGLRREWFQGLPAHRHEHYDLRPNKRLAAIEAGAKPITRKELGRMMAVKDGLLPAQHDALRDGRSIMDSPTEA